MDDSAWRLFDRVAAEYDDVVPFFAEFGAAIVAVLDPEPGCRFLDVGAGRGALTAPALDRGCTVTAVDAAPAMLGRLAASYPAAATHVMDAEALAFPDGSFDLAAAAFVIHLLDNPAAGVAEAYRVLVPGGRFALTGGSTQGGSAPAQEPSLGRLLDALFIEFTPFLRPGGSMGRPLDAAELLAEAGFVDLREQRAEVAIRFDDNAVLWRWAMSHGYRAFIEDLPDDRRREFRRRVMELSGHDGVLRRVTGVWSGAKPR